MQLDTYKSAFDSFFGDKSIRENIHKSVAMLQQTERVLFIGNGGSNAICSHMMEDFMKMARKQTLSFSDAALITCFSNDYGYEYALSKWIEFNYRNGDVLIAISSSGESVNILNAVEMHNSLGGKVITLSGFTQGNSLSTRGDINFQTPISNYGIVETFHQVILHAILDEMV